MSSWARGEIFTLLWRRRAAVRILRSPGHMDTFWRSPTVREEVASKGKQNYLNNFKKSQWSSWYFKKDYAKSRIYSIKGQLFLMIFTKDHLLYLQKRLYLVVFYKISLVVRIFEKRLFYLPSLAIHSYPWRIPRMKASQTHRTPSSSTLRRQGSLL